MRKIILIALSILLISINVYADSFIGGGSSMPTGASYCVPYRDSNAAAQCLTPVNNAILGFNNSGVFGAYTSFNFSTLSVGTLTVTGHPVIEGVTSTGATGTGNFVFGTAPTLTGPNYPVYTSTTTTTGNVNIDGASYSHYSYTYVTDATAQTYTPVITSAPGAGYIRYITLTFGSAATTATLTITWTNVTQLGTLATSVTAGKRSTYACMLTSTPEARCAIVKENY